MRKLTNERRAAVIRALVEGNSIRNTIRMTSEAVMAWGDPENEGKKKCEKCGEEYTLYSHKWPMRERGWAKCKCGEVLIAWNGSRGYSVKFIDGTYGESEEH